MVNSAAFSPDDQRILTASDDRTARVWGIKGNLLATLQGHTGAVNSAMFSVDGQRILTASDDRTARVWTLDAKLLTTLQGHTDAVRRAVFSSNGGRILTASVDGTARQYVVDVRDLRAKRLSHRAQRVRYSNLGAPCDLCDSINTYISVRSSYSLTVRNRLRAAVARRQLDLAFRRTSPELLRFLIVSPGAPAEPKAPALAMTSAPEALAASMPAPKRRGRAKAAAMEPPAPMPAPESKRRGRPKKVV